MAEGFVFDTAKTLLGVLGSPVFHEIQLPRRVEAEIEKLTGKVESLTDVLVDAEQQHSKKKNEELTLWLRRLKDALYEADDFLHDFATQLKQQQMVIMTGNEMTRKVCFLFSKFNLIASSLTMARQIRAVREKLEDIQNDRQFQLREHRDEERIENRETKQTRAFVHEEMIIGRDDDKNAIIKLMLDSDHDKNVSVIPIVGMGGLGKTTLVRLVYNDKEVDKLFPLRIWVCVSKEFNVQTIIRRIIKSVTREDPKKADMKELQECLHEEMDGKKYLLVLDDIWNDNCHKWAELKELLMNGAKGSKILVTTRCQEIATMTNEHLSYVLKGLAKKESWSLFKQIVFKHGIEPKDSRLVAIGKEIVDKCAGVPLAIRVIGYLLYDKYKKNDWLHFRDNELPKIPQIEDDILPILQFSYDHLLPHLQQCFACCALFPKDHEIKKQKLIFLWRAQGFLQSNRNQCLKEVGNNYFEDLLLMRSFFQDPKYNKWENLISCKVHDLMHDLAYSVVRSECAMATLNTENINESCRHLSLYYGDNINRSWKFSNALFRKKYIRSLLLLDQSHVGVDSVDWDKIFSSYKHLRSLDFGKFKFNRLSSSICKLRYLRYLNISQNLKLERLPNFILRLTNLETLDLTGCSKLQELPTNIVKMVNLRDLMIEGCDSLIGSRMD